jgi:hypothetical protein
MDAKFVDNLKANCRFASRGVSDRGDGDSSVAISAVAVSHAFSWPGNIDVGGVNSSGSRVTGASPLEGQ